MNKIPQFSKPNRVLSWLTGLPVSVQIALVLLLFYLTWSFRYVTDGIDPKELQKVEGTLYSFKCIPYPTGSDTIILHTSLQNQPIHFSGWQKCTNIAEHMSLSNTPQKATFYITKHKGPLSNSAEGSVWIHAIDVIAPVRAKIYPHRGLGIEYVPNIYCLIFFFLALYLLDNLRGIWSKRKP